MNMVHDIFQMHFNFEFVENVEKAFNKAEHIFMN